MPQRPRVVVTGATGNVGVRTVEALAADPQVGEVIGLARRRPAIGPPGVRYVGFDLAPPRAGVPEPDPLIDVLAGADAVVHLAWIIQPTRVPYRLWEVNAVGSRRLFAAAAAAGVERIVNISSVGAYSPAAPGTWVDESWPTDGIATSHYSLAKAYVERLLDDHEARHPTRVVRLRPSLIVQRPTAAHVRRLFVGGLVPDAAFGAVTRTPIVPDVPGIAVQLTHTEDVAEAIRAAVTRDVSGAFNLAAEPALDLPAIAEAFGARTVPVPPRLARAALTAAWNTRLLPVDPGWFDMGLHTPLLRSDRARRELDWRPRWDAESALFDVLEGLRDGAGDHTPPLEGDEARSRLVELATTRQGGGEVR